MSPNKLILTSSMVAALSLMVLLGMAPQQQPNPVSDEQIHQLLQTIEDQRVAIRKLQEVNAESASQLATMQGELIRRKREFEVALADARAALDRQKAAADMMRKTIVNPSKVFGGLGGDHRYGTTVTAPVRTITIWYGGMINGIIFNDADWAPGLAGGRRRENYIKITLHNGEKITSITHKYGKGIDSLVIKTNLGAEYRCGGNGGDHTETFEIPDGQVLSGAVGLAGEGMDSVSWLTRPE